MSEFPASVTIDTVTHDDGRRSITLHADWAEDGIQFPFEVSEQMASEDPEVILRMLLRNAANDLLDTSHIVVQRESRRARAIAKLQAVEGTTANSIVAKIREARSVDAATRMLSADYDLNAEEATALLDITASPSFSGSPQPEPFGLLSTAIASTHSCSVQSSGCCVRSGP